MVEVDCADGQLARLTGTFSDLGGWLDAMFDRLKDYAVYAGDGWCANSPFPLEHRHLWVALPCRTLGAAG
jgi:phosphatidylglycerophosphate synthase